MSERNAIVAGVGMVAFTKPGAGDAYPAMARTVVAQALADAGLAYGDVGQAYVGYVYGDSTAGQRALYETGLTGIPIVNVNNNCATGSTALFLARQAVECGAVDCALALGFEQMNPGAIGVMFRDRPSPLEKFEALTDELTQAAAAVPMALRYFGAAGAEHMKRYGTRLETFAKIRAKASRHAARNPLALLRKELTEEEVMASPAVWPGVLTRLMACPPTCGAAAAVIVSTGFAARRGLGDGIPILAQAMTTDTETSFSTHDMRDVVGATMAREAAHQVYERAGIGPQEVDVVELHDCFAQNELLSYESLDLCPEGGAEKFVLDGDNTYGGAFVVNPSGGLLSKGHPLGATGLAQCYELVQQLRGRAEARQVEGARIAMQHNLGLGGACVVTLYAAR